MFNIVLVHTYSHQNKLLASQAFLPQFQTNSILYKELSLTQTKQAPRLYPSSLHINFAQNEERRSPAWYGPNLPDHAVTLESETRDSLQFALDLRLIYKVATEAHKPFQVHGKVREATVHGMSYAPGLQVQGQDQRSSEA